MSFFKKPIRYHLPLTVISTGAYFWSLILTMFDMIGAAEVYQMIRDCKTNNLTDDPDEADFPDLYCWD